MAQSPSSTVRVMSVPPASEIARHLPGADFHDCHAVDVDTRNPSALSLYLDVVKHTPTWVGALMTLRNHAVGLVGLKNLGALDGVSPDKPASDYRVGDRIGIFTLYLLTDDEIILGDADKHLRVELSVYKLSDALRPAVAVSTVVHIHNALGRIYMLFVTPLHKRIVPAILRRASITAPERRS